VRAGGSPCPLIETLSLGTVVTRLGAVLIVAALIILAVGLLRNGRQG
jgi:hypothetical protein